LHCLFSQTENRAFCFPWQRAASLAAICSTISRSHTSLIVLFLRELTFIRHEPVFLCFRFLSALILRSALHFLLIGIWALRVVSFTLNVSVLSFSSFANPVFCWL
jgi:hypothetical protein